MMVDTHGTAGRGDTPETGNADRGTQTGGGLATWQWSVLVVVALLLIGIYLLLAFLVFNSRGDEAEQWARALVVLGGIEALAFAAAGWLFGREVNRRAVERAEADANEARDANAQTESELATAKVRAAVMATALQSSHGDLRLSNTPSSRDPEPALADAARILAEYGQLGTDS